MTEPAAALDPRQHGRGSGAGSDLAFAAVVLGVLAVLLLSRSMHHDLDHDEHQFVASAALLARRGLLPYRDYPYFHTPGLVFVYAAIFKTCTSHLLLGARL